MHKTTTTVLIRLYAVLLWIFGFVLLGKSLGLAIDTSDIQAIFSISAATVRAAAFVVGAFLLVLGFFILKHKRWARKAVLIVSSIMVIGGTLFIVRCEELVCFTWLVSLPLNVLRILVGAFGLWFFGHEAEHSFR